MKRVLSAILSILILVSIVSPITSNAATYTYNPDAAISYAKAHYNDGKGLCAEFVSDCLKAGGFTAVYNVNARNLGRQLQGYGTKITCSGWSSSSCLKASMFSGELSKGDVIIWENVSSSSSSGHAMLYSGKTNSKGQILVYAHNSAKNEEVIMPSSSASTVYAIHLTSTNENNYTYSFNFNANGGTLGSSGAFSVKYGEQFQILNTTCTRSGYTWAGWNVKRNNDNKWYVDGQGWRSESEISSNGYIKKVYSNYKTVTLDNSWIGGISGNGSYTFYAVWIQSRANTLKVFLSPYGEGYDHVTALNNYTNSGYAQNKIYAWYVLYDRNTGELMNTYSNKTYSVELAVYDPNGDLVFNHNYTDSGDANWIGITPQMSGTYTATATISGAYSGSISTTYEVSYDTELLSSVNSVSLNLNGTNSKNIVFTPVGYYPGLKGYKATLDSSIASITEHYWSSGQFYFTIQGNKVGSTTLYVELYEDYSGNKNVVATISIPVTVTANSYSINYNANGGTGAPSSQTKYYGTNITLSSTVPTRSGYTFLGWSTSSTATSATYQPGSTFSSNANTTLYAVWKADATALSENSTSTAYISPAGTTVYYTCTPSVSGKYVIYSVGDSDGRVYLYNSSGTLLDNDDDGGEERNFRLEYYMSAGTTYRFGINLYDSSLSLPIVFRFGKVYTVSYNANGGSGAPSVQSKDYGADIVLSATIPSKTGYTFRGWSLSSSATSVAYMPGDTFAVNANTTLYAVWEAQGYSILFDANGGSGAPSQQFKIHNQTLTLSSTKPTRFGYTFLGWSTSSTATSATYQPGGSYTANAATRLYAVWRNDTSSLSANSSINATISTGGEMKYYSFTPTTSGTYVIYSTGSDDTKVYLYNTSGTELDSDDDDGDGNNFRLEYNLNAGTTYTFGVRYYNSSKTGTISFKFGNVYTITYNANGGSGVPSSQKKDHGTDITLSSTTPTKTGYTFLGWATSSTATSATYQPGSSFTANANTTLYAVWKQGCENGAHSYSYTATKAPTTSATGTLTGTCSKCSGTTIVTLPKLTTTDYTYKVTTAATCTATGTGRYTWKTTTYGTFHFDVTIPATGHTYTNKVTAPTCTAQGYTTHTCSCGYSYKDNYTDALGHSYSNGSCTRFGAADPDYAVDENAPKVVVNGATAAPGSTVTADVTLQNNPGISYLAMTLSYDKSVMTLVSVENGSIISDFDNGANLIWSADKNVTANGVLCRLTFKISDSANVGEYPVDLTMREAYNFDAQEVKIKVVNTSLAISNILYGDANGDGTINGKDVLLLRKYMVNYNYDTGISTETVYLGADANGDGTVNGKDVLLMRKYMANYDYDKGTSTIVLGPGN